MGEDDFVPLGRTSGAVFRRRDLHGSRCSVSTRIAIRFVPWRPHVSALCSAGSSRRRRSSATFALAPSASRCANSSQFTLIAAVYSLHPRDWNVTKTTDRESVSSCPWRMLPWRLLHTPIAMLANRQLAVEECEPRSGSLCSPQFRILPLLLSNEIVTGAPTACHVASQDTVVDEELNVSECRVCGRFGEVGIFRCCEFSFEAVE